MIFIAVFIEISIGDFCLSQKETNRTPHFAFLHNPLLNGIFPPHNPIKKFDKLQMKMLRTLVQIIAFTWQEMASDKTVLITNSLPFQHPSEITNIYYSHFGEIFYKMSLLIHVFPFQMI